MAAHRWWRVKYGASPRGICSLATVIMREVVGGPDVTQGAGGVAIADSFYNGSYAPDKAFDDNPATFWSNNGPAGYVGYVFPADAPRDIIEVALLGRPDDYCDDDAPTAFTLEYSDDGATWHDTASFSAIPPFQVGQFQTFDAPPPAPLAATVLGSTLIAVTRETPPAAGGAVIAATAIVAVQIPFTQPYRNVQLPLIAGPWAFPLFIAKGI